MTTISNTRILFTGGNGFIGRNVLPILKEKYEIYTPKRDELNLFNEITVQEFVKKHSINCIIHSANPNPSKNNADTSEKLLRDSLLMFMSIYSCRDMLEKVIYIGSGAIYDKSKDIVAIKETDAFRSIPKDDYGFAKYIMNTLTCNNVYNLCVFGCYGDGDAESKFITHCIRCCIKNKPITIRQNCMFDYIQVYDLAKIMAWFIDTKPKYNMYNVCSGQRVSLLEIASIVKQKMKSDCEIVILKDGWNNEYTGSNDRLLGEYKQELISLDKGIDIQIAWERENYKA